MRVATKGAPFTVFIQPHIISAEKARKRANVWLLVNIGNLLRADNPRLIINEQHRLCWQVDVVLTSPEHGPMGHVGQIEISVFTAEVLTDVTVYKEFVVQADALIDN
ncbi:hypothetical protein QUF63_00500 [Anaerolineales bacterium HSG25]|nr:hypothetical protein [Anaerolineales bacterium HSG25]